MKSIYDLTYEQLEEMILEHGWKKYRGKQIFQWLYRKRVTAWNKMSDIPLEMQETLSQEYTLKPLELLNKQVSSDGTRKYLFSLDDGATVETVLMKYNYGNCVCVTSQVGCNMGCTFCASGLLKKKRDLTTGEIVQQVLMVQNDLDRKSVV